jgi:hypothetical protein
MFLVLWIYFLSGAILIVYALIRIREIHRTQLSVYYILLYSLLRQHFSTLSRGHHQAIEVIIKS